MKVIAVFLFFVLVTSSGVFSQSIKIDLENSSLKWEGKKVTGKHWGNISLKEGNVTIKNDMFTGGLFIANMKTIDCDDIKDEEWNQKLLDHLASDDFFSTSRYGTSKMVITKVMPLGNMKYKFIVDLTIKDITKSQEFEGLVSKERNYLKANGSIIIDRTDYDIKYGSGSFFDNLGDRTISDDFSLEFNISVELPQ